MLKTFDNDSKMEPFPKADWKLTDVLVVSSLCIFVPVISYTILRLIFGNSLTAFRLERYVGGIWGIFVPIWWIRHKYALSKAALGIRKGNSSTLLFGLTGICVIIAYSILIHFSALRPQMPRIQGVVTYFDYIFLPLSIGGFLNIILIPINEEIIYRGFIYSYMRTKIGVILGIILQASLFSLMHFPFDSSYTCWFQLLLFLHRFVIGIIFGILYERTLSLYPSIICHATLNYCGMILPFILSANVG